MNKTSIKKFFSYILLVIYMFIAHRGLVKNSVTENTIPAFLGAINDPHYAGFELDIYTTKDHVFVVNHDPLVHGKYIGNYKYAELKKLGLIKLEDVLKLKHSKIILIEIKDLNLDVAKLTKLLNKYAHHQIYVMSFFNSVIKKFPKPKFKIGVLNYLLNSTDTYNYDFIGLLYGIATPPIIEAFKKLNIEVFLYALSKNSKFNFPDVYYIIDAKLLS